MEVLRRDIKLQIDNFEDDRKLNDAIRICCKLLRDYMIRLQHAAVLHRERKCVPLNRG